MDDNLKIQTPNSQIGDSGKRTNFDDPFIGLIIGDRYQIIERIGTGGWGSVYKARHLTLSMDLAIKIVHQHHLQDELSIRRFEQEAQLLSRVDSPHIVRIIDHGMSPSPFIVMEYVPGISLRNWLKTQGPMPPQMAIDLFLQLCEALGAAEAIHIVHRDLKPANILLKSDIEGVDCKILDFGLAKFFDVESSEEKLTNTGEILGSPAYMSPEQWKGQCDHRSDLYALGCIMYETLTGKPPFSAQRGLEYMSKHVTERPPTISQSIVGNKLPAGIADIIYKCLEKTPANRYQSSMACREDLMKLKAGGKPSINIFEKLRRNSNTLVVIGAFLLCLGLCASYFWYQSRDVEYNLSQSRGKYFEKKIYSGAAVPKFESSKNKLPNPILEDDPQLVELYWKAWELAFQNLRRPPAGSPLVSNYSSLGANLYQWDTIFITMFGRYGQQAFPFIESLDNFYARQYENGYICQVFAVSDGADRVFSSREDTVNPPLFAWAELEYARLTGDSSRFRKVFPVLTKHAEWLEKYRRKAGTVHGLYWNTRLGSGMDTTPRSGSGWVDMSSQMVLMYKSMAEIASQLKIDKSAQEYQQRAFEIAKSINRYMWDDKDGLYYDIDDQAMPIPCKSVACFWPMLAGVCNDDQVLKLMNNLRDPKTFWRHNVFPSLAADQATYIPDSNDWHGAVWAPSNVMIVKGLDNYPECEGQEKLAVGAVKRYLDNMYAVYKNTGTIWQNYSTESDTHGKMCLPDFVGWSGAGPIQLLIEDIIGIQADGSRKKIHWRLARSDRHGIEKFQFGGITASLVCARRINTNSPAVLTITTDAPFDLRVSGHKVKNFRVLPGTHSYHLD